MTIEIKATDSGPIKSLEIVLRHPGIYVVTGANGAGKTKLLDGIDYADGTGNEWPEKRIGAKAGSIEVAGAILKLGQKVTRGGKLTIQSVAGQRCLGVLIDADGVADGARADARRIEALIQMGDVKGGTEAFLALDPAVNYMADEYPADMPFTAIADAVRGRLNALGLQAEKDAADYEAKSQGAKAAAGDVDAALADADPDVLRDDLAQALAEQSRLQAERQAAVRSQAAAEEARKKLAAIPREDSMDSLIGLGQLNTAKVKRLDAEVESAERLLEHAKQDLINAQRERADAIKDGDRLHGEIESAKRNAATRVLLERQIAAGTSTGPTTEEMSAAQEAVRLADERTQKGAVARRSREQLAAADVFAEAAEVAAFKAKRLRKAAKDVDGVLAAQIATLGTPCRVEDGRLWAELGPRPGEHGIRLELVHDLSPGERAKLFCSALVAKLGPGGLGTVDQETWLRMDGAGKLAFATMTQDAGAYILAEGVEEDPVECGKPVSVRKYAVGEE